jgi:hypothetical protein
VAGRPYSERFLHVLGAGYSPIYTVPQGQRAILKSIVSFNPSGAAGQVVLELKGSLVWSVPVPGGQGGVSPPFMLVVYAGETVRLFNGATGQYSALSGYLLAG